MIRKTTLPFRENLPKLMYSLIFAGMFGSLFAQGHDNVWVFGNGGGVNFTNGVPSIQTPAPLINTLEGSASISDASGNLIFYTDGINAWNGSNNQLVSSSLNGNPSSTQSGVIIPKPGTDDYYILAVDFRDGNGGMRYYDANVTAGNLTSVTPQNGTILITNPSEKIAAFRKPCDPDTIWVVGHNYSLGRYEVFAATNAGITATGATIADQFTTINPPSNKLGVLRFNHNGTLLASAVWANHVELIGFNPQTGQFINTTRFKFDVNTAAQPERNPYGLEFSPDNQSIYLTVTGSSSLANNQLLQFDISTLTEVAIENSRLILQNFGNGVNRFEAGQLQLAPDGNIYASMRRVGNPTQQRTFLGRISNPNTGGVANWNATAVPGPLNQLNWAVYGLPNFLTELLPVINHDVDVCVGSSTQLNAGAGSNYTWTPVTGLSCTTCSNPVASPGTNTTYTAQYLDPNGNCVREEFRVAVIVCDPCDTLSLRARFSGGLNGATVTVQDFSTVNPPDGISYIEWNFGDGQSGWILDSPGTDYTYTYQQSGTYEICVRAVVFVSPNICCHDTFCLTIDVKAEPCDGYTGAFDVQIPNGLTVGFRDVTPGGSDVSIWNFGDGTTATTAGTSVPSVLHTYPSNGSYLVRLISIRHINDTTCCIDTVFREVEVWDGNNKVDLTPTLAEESLNLSLDIEKPQEASLRIFNAAGKVILWEKSLQNGERSIEIQQLPTGFYYLEIKGKDWVKVRKFVKQ